MDFQELTNGEKSRTYIYDNGFKFTVDKVARICVRSSGSHRLETEDGRKFIVNPGWIAIEVAADKWSV